MAPVRIYLAVCLFFLATVSMAAGVAPGKLNATALTDYFEDKTTSLSFENVAIAPETQWQRLGLDATRFAFSKSAYWFRIRLDQWPELKPLRQLFVVFEWKPLDSVEFFYKTHAGTVSKQIAGDAFPKSQWSLPEAHFPAMEIFPGETAGAVLYVRLASTSLMNFPIWIKSQASYVHDLKGEANIIFAYSTIILVLVAFALFLYFVSRDSNYLFYMGYIFFASLAFTTIYGNGFDLFWPEASWWQNRAGFAFMGIQVVFTMLFVRSILDFPRYLPKVDLFCKILAAICAISVPLTLTPISVVFFSRLISIVYLISIPAFFIIGLFLIKKSGPHIRLFMAGWGILFFFAMFHVLFILNILPFSNFRVYGVMFVLPIDIMFLFVAVWEKQRAADRERMRMLDEKMEALLTRSPGESKAKYQKSSLTDVDVQSTLSRLNILMNAEKIYLIEDLRLPDLAKALGLNRTQLSELLNSHFQKNFANFINEYRVQEAQRLLVDNPDQNVLDIAFATGFGSKAAFSTEFKRLTGTTAKDFREKSLEKTAS
jgi:two-component system, sensor histidine kinase LadS